jgi:hypothetical protein
MVFAASIFVISASGCWRERGRDTVYVERGHEGDHHGEHDRDHDREHPHERR